MLKVENKDIKISYFIDENDIPTKLYVNEEKQRISPEGLIQLQCLPSNNTAFEIFEKGTNREFTEVESIVNDYDFIVKDKERGILKFNTKKAGAEILVSYMAIGELIYSSDRIFTNTNSQGEVIETLGDIISEYKKILESIRVIGDAAIVIEQTQANIDALKSLNLNGILTKAEFLKSELEKIVPESDYKRLKLQEVIRKANELLTRLEDWVKAHQNIVNIDNRVAQNTTDLNIAKGDIVSIRGEVSRIDNNLNSTVLEVNNIKDKVNKTKHNPEIHYLNGSPDEDATLLKFSNGKTALIDCGETWTANWLCDKLNKLGVTKIDFLIITHSHSDHVGGATTVMDRLRPDVIYYKDITWQLSNKEIGWETDSLHRAMVNKAKELGIQRVVVNNGDITIDISDGEYIRLLNCEPYPYADKTQDNNYTLYSYNYESIMVEYNFLGSKILIQSDCPSSVGYSKYGDTIGKVQHLKMCHHGGHDVLSKPWLLSLRPTQVFYTYEQMDNLEFYKANVVPQLYVRDHTLNYSGCFIVTTDGVIPTSTVKENRLENRFINYEGKKCFVDAHGELIVNGIIESDGKFYIIKDWYLVQVSNEGDWFYVDNESYALRLDGSIIRNEWVQSKDTWKWYYCGDDGKYYKNTTKIIGMTSVTFDSEGNPNIQPT